MDRQNLERAAARYPYMQGLLFVPIGLWFMLGGLAQLIGDPMAPWLYVFGAVAGVAAYLRIGRYYKQNYGQVTPPRSRRIRDLVATLLAVPVIIGGAILDSALNLPLNGYVAGYGVVMLLYSAGVIGLKTHHLVIWGALVLAGLMPVWGATQQNDVPLGLPVMGLATIAAGIFDHRLLVRTYGTTGALEPHNSNAGS